MGFAKKKAYFLVISSVSVWMALSQPSWASHPHRYASTVNDGTAEVINADSRLDIHQPPDVYLGQSFLSEKTSSQKRHSLPPPQHISQKVKMSPMVFTASKPKKATVTPVPELAPKFDHVPRQLIARLEKRMKYAQYIVKKYGRAYSYRTTTLHQFKRILASLQKRY